MQYLYIGCAFVSGIVLMKILNRNNDSSAGKDGKKYSTVKLFFILYIYMLLIPISYLNMNMRQKKIMSYL